MTMNLYIALYMPIARAYCNSEVNIHVCILTRVCVCVHQCQSIQITLCVYMYSCLPVIDLLFFDTVLV